MLHYNLIWGQAANLVFTFDSQLMSVFQWMHVRGNIANVKCCYSYDTMSPSEQHMHNSSSTNIYWNVNCFKMYNKSFVFQVCYAASQHSSSSYTSSWHLSLPFYTVIQSKTQSHPYNGLTGPTQTDLTCLTSWHLLLFSLFTCQWNVKFYCRGTNGPSYCVEYQLHTQYTRVDIKESSIKEFPNILEMRLNNTHNENQ